MKQCNKCKETKPLTEFHRDKRAKGDGFQYRCKSCSKKEGTKRYKEEIEYFTKYREKNKDKIRQYNKQYYIENKGRIIEKNKKYQYRKIKEDNFFKLKRNISSRIYKAIKIKYKKNKRTIEYLGCSILFYEGFLQNKFKEGMTWNNYGDWHIDHIIPLASANTEEELIKLFHYTNTQPLWAEENLKKSDKIL